MRGDDVPGIIGLAMFSVVAAAAGAALIAGWTDFTYAAGGALIVLAVGQTVAIAVTWQRASRQRDRLNAQARTLRTIAQDVEKAVARLDTLEARVAAVPTRPVDDVVKEMKALRDSFHELAKDYVSPSKPAPEPAPAPPRPTAPEATRDRLDLYLEPIIELENGNTRHYRALLSMSDSAGREVAHAALMSSAEAGGVRAALDLHLLRQALPILRRLRPRHTDLCLFVPLGAQTLTSRTELDRALTLLEGASDVARGIVFELSHAQLGALDANGIEGLARLGRLGVTMGLSQVSVAGLDLAALHKLGVHYLAVEAASLDSGFGLAPSWFEFAQHARALRFQIVAQRIESTIQASAASQVARYGSGPFYAPPRKVKPEASAEAAADVARAA